MSERETLTRIAAAMSCVPDDDADLVEAVRESVRERDEAIARAETAEAAFAALREAAVAYRRAIDTEGGDDWMRAGRRGPRMALDNALTALPADLAAERDRRVRAEALEDAADDSDREESYRVRWLRARAADERGGR